jgi:Mycobacterium membrane protein
LERISTRLVLAGLSRMTASSTPGTGKVVGKVMRVLRTLQLGWIPLVLVAALALSGFAIHRMHGIFGSHQSPGASGSNDQNLWVRRDVAHVSELVDWRSAVPIT